MTKLEEIGASFRSVDTDLRLQLLLDYANKLPAVPERLRAAEQDHRVHECMTPLFLWIEPAEEDRLRLYIDVAEEAPTIRGIAGVLVRALDNAPKRDFEALPDDLIATLGLQQVLRMNRAVGVAALVGRIRRAAA
ncbi:MAG: SufE family protein [Planctomycetota bacterium]